eukprot:UN14530
MHQLLKDKRPKWKIELLKLDMDKMFEIMVNNKGFILIAFEQDKRTKYPIVVTPSTCPHVGILVGDR